MENDVKDSHFIVERSSTLKTQSEKIFEPLKLESGKEEVFNMAISTSIAKNKIDTNNLGNNNSTQELRLSTISNQERNRSEGLSMTQYQLDSLNKSIENQDREKTPKKRDTIGNNNNERIISDTISLNHRTEGISSQNALFKDNPFIKKEQAEKQETNKMKLAANFFVQQEQEKKKQMQKKEISKSTKSENSVFKKDPDNPFIKLSMQKMAEIEERKKKEVKEKSISSAIKDNPFFKAANSSEISNQKQPSVATSNSNPGAKK